MKWDVIIIGSGLGGLECAHMLSAEGFRVLVLEREAQPGGCLQSYRRKGFEWDTGFHYVGGLDEGQALHEPFRRLGLLDLPWVRLDADCFDRIHIGGHSYDFAQGYDRFVDTLARRFPSEEKALRGYVDMLRQSSRHQFDWQKASPVQGLAGSANIQAMSTPAWQWLHSRFHDPLLIDVLSGNAMRMELRRATLPLFTFAHINSSYIAGSWRLRGSGRLIVERLVDGIRQAGGQVACNAGVRQLVERDGRIVAARCDDGATREASLFISDIHPMLTCDLIGESRVVRKSLRRRMHLMENTHGMLTVSLLVRPDTLPYAGRNDYVYRKPGLWDDCGSGGPVSGVMVSRRVPETGSAFTRQVDLLTPVAWGECQQWQDTRVGHRGDSYEAWKQGKADECVHLAETAIPGLSSMVEDRFVSTPLTWRSYTLTPGGSAYGLRKDCGNPLLTFLPARTPEPNLFLTGQSLMLHGVEGVTMTAMMTCNEIRRQQI